MRITVIAAATAGLLFAGAGQASPTTPPKPPRTTQTVEIHKTINTVDGKEIASAVADATMANCAGYRFETKAEAGGPGEKQVSQIKLCAGKDESKATWIATLEKAAARVRSDGDMPAAARAKIVADFDAEIARLKTGG